MQKRLKIITPLEPIYNLVDLLCTLTLMNFAPYMLNHMSLKGEDDIHTSHNALLFQVSKSDPLATAGHTVAVYSWSIANNIVDA